MAVERRVERRMATTRERLVNTALALFATHGIYDATVEDITEAADVGKGTFYQHFPSKTAIIHHILHDGVSELLDRCRRESQLAKTHKDRVKRLLSAQFRFFDERTDLLVLFHQVRGLLKLKPRDVRSLQKEYDRYIRFLTAELGTLLDRRHYSRTRLMQIACSMAGLVTGYLSYRMILGLKKHEAIDLEVPTRLFLEGIGGNGQAMP
ncbi:TetR/AcrR family transcriptional regulator [Candidatus Methylomirabilis sp.]|uniref:TetR/AcrR family transcriptional regulator n=1 Tax=Candidatus Methylomirabilis sp. TaxID=2032687 RepID=UPI002A5C2153|nr:TetR/AcrR family transcriptional regulator [Candidatus Methylomirabilis sp.]